MRVNEYFHKSYHSISSLFLFNQIIFISYIFFFFPLPSSVLTTKQPLSLHLVVIKYVRKGRISARVWRNWHNVVNWLQRIVQNILKEAMAPACFFIFSLLCRLKEKLTMFNKKSGPSNTLSWVATYKKF